MKLLLINKNPIVKKLVKLSADKAGIDIDEVESLDDVSSFDYEFVFIDDESLEDGALDSLSAQIDNAKLGLIHGKDSERVAGFSLFVQKPFLPTDMVDLLKSEVKKIGGVSQVAESNCRNEPEESLLDISDDSPVVADVDVDSGNADIDVDMDSDLGDGVDFDLESELAANEAWSAGASDLGEEMEEMPAFCDLDLDFNSPIENTESAELDNATLEVDSSLDDMADLDIDLGEETKKSNASIGNNIDMELEIPAGVDEPKTGNKELGDNKPSEEDALTQDVDIPEDISLDSSFENKLEGSDEETVAQSDSLPETMDFGDLELDDAPVSGNGGVMLDRQNDDLDFDMSEEASDMVEEGGILDIQDVEAVKDLLKDDELSTAVEDLDMDDIKIESGDLASLTEEALSEALGEEMASSEEDFDIEDIGAEKFEKSDDEIFADESGVHENIADMASEMPVAPAPVATPATNNASIAPQEAFKGIQGLSIPALKELLDGMQLTISISFPNKK
ncbi:MAG: hypothetical protein ACTTJS_07355 [Wolinella sp.]